jgi:hypothetical protein
MIPLVPRQLLILFSLIAITQLLFASSVTAQRKATQPRATSFRLEKNPHALDHDLFITVNGLERKVTTKAHHAWIIDQGRSVVYSGADGSGGFENEGESLRIYDVRTGSIRKILSEYVAVWAVQEIRLSNGQLALLVSMADGGLGGSYFAVVDPRRGQVMYRRWAEVTAINGDQITLAFYRADDWETINEPRRPDEGDRNKVIALTTVKPVKIEHHDLKRVLRGKVIHNKRDPM